MQLADLTGLDWLLLALMAVSVLAALLRGFVREAVSLSTWVAAFFVAAMFAPGMETLLAEYIESDELRQLVAFVALFIATLLMGSLLAYVAGFLVKMTGLSPLDRLLGMGFGAVRGVVVAVVAALVVSLALESSGVRPDWYTDSVLVPHLLLMEHWVRDAAEQIAGWIRGIIA